MSVEYGLLSLFVAFAYGVLVKFVPDFPLTQELVLSFLIWALVKFGVSVTEQPVRTALAVAKASLLKRFPSLAPVQKVSKKSK